MVDFQCRSYAAANAFVSYFLISHHVETPQYCDRNRYNAAAKWNHNLTSKRDDRRKESMCISCTFDTIVEPVCQIDALQMFSRRSLAEKSDLSAS